MSFPQKLWRRIDALPVATAIRMIVDQHPRRIALLFFVGGFVWDYFTLTRVDAVFDNVLLLLYVVVVSVLGYFAMLRWAGATLPNWVKRGERWLPLAMQFAFGALFSANVIFYWQSTTLTAGALYFLLLVTLLVANEFVPHDKSPVILFALLFIGSHSFFMFMVPVALGRMGFWPFFLAGMLGVALCGFVLWRLALAKALPSRRSRAGSVAMVVGLFVLSNIFYLNKLIPPVPLAVRSVGVYHSVEREGNRFVLAYEPAGRIFGRYSPSTVFHREPDAPVYCFASVFAPRRFQSRIVHAWYVFDYAQDDWVIQDRIGYDVEGGRENGFRGYTFKQNVKAGEWRVDVETEDGFVIGRTHFDVVDALPDNRDLRVQLK